MINGESVSYYIDSIRDIMNQLYEVDNLISNYYLISISLNGFSKS